MSVRELQTDLELEVSDALSDLTADLMSLKEFEVVLKRLFVLDAGVWLPLANLCPDIAAFKARLDVLESEAEGTLQVAWLEYPASAYGEGYCTVMFFVESIHWHSIALYNKARLDRHPAA